MIKHFAEQAFIAVKPVYPKACINHLYAIEGAIRGVRWHGISKNRKSDLKNFYDRFNSDFIKDT